jgi:HlyD family secretion protein
MSCRAEVLTNTQDDAKVLAVPVQAVRYEDNTDKSAKAEKSVASVYIYNAGRAVKRAVSTGTADDSYIAITSGLKEGEQVIVGPAKTVLFLVDGEKVGMNVKDPAKAELAAKK